MTRKTYVRFVDLPGIGTEVQTLSGDELGAIVWYARWRQYVFEPEYGCVFSYDCMEDIAEQVKAMNAAKKAGVRR